MAVRTGNVSAGTSIFANIVLEHDLSKPYEEIDLVTTPAGDLVAMAHSNNCTSDLNDWVGLFREFADSFGMKVDTNELYGTLYPQGAGRRPGLRRAVVLLLFLRRAYDPL